MIRLCSWALNIGISRQTIINNALNGISTASWVRFQGFHWSDEELGLQDGFRVWTAYR
ncbi:MAG: hypothetical protein LBK43_04300 [Treponema sp.]|nr:hypothetical protein [Treponema sp.]